MDYKNSVIYKICCKDSSIKDCYVGSSCSHTSRKSAHKSACNNKKDKAYNLPVYRYIRDNGNWENWDFVLLEAYPCENKNQLVIRERYWFEKLGAKLNSFYPQISKEERKEYMKEYRKNWEEENKEQRKEYKKYHYAKNKVEIKERKKKHYEENKVEIIEKQKEYNRKKNEKISEKVECECGSVVRKDYLQRHKRTQKHQKNLQKLSESKK